MFFKNLNLLFVFFGLIFCVNLYVMNFIMLFKFKVKWLFKNRKVLNFFKVWLENIIVFVVVEFCLYVMLMYGFGLFFKNLK